MRVATLGMVALASALIGAACKERGTIQIDLSQSCPTGTVTSVRFQAIKNGTCGACTCSTCTCTDTPDQQCIADVPCGGAGCPIAQARENGIDFDPPSAGRYALTYELLDSSAGPAAIPVAVFCTVVDVDADGTASHTEQPAPTCCM